MVPLGVPVVPLLYGRIAMQSAAGGDTAGGDWRELRISLSSGPRDSTCRTESTRAAALSAWTHRAAA